MPPKLRHTVLVDKREGGWVRIDMLLGCTVCVQASLPEEGGGECEGECLFRSIHEQIELHNHSSHSVCFIHAYLAFK
jgi:hypothetical protein